jgi:hypothetical protein
LLWISVLIFRLLDFRSNFQIAWFFCQWTYYNASQFFQSKLYEFEVFVPAG